MLELGVAVGIGTDGPASNNDLDMFEEMRLAALLAKGISGDPDRAAGARRRWRWRRASARARFTSATSPARSSPASAPISSSSISIRPTTSPRFARDADAVYSQLVYAAKSTDVVDVMCDGRWLMRDRRLLTLDEDELQSRGARRGAAHRRVPDRARAERAAEADRDRRRRRTGELRGPGEGARSPRADVGAARAGRATRSRSFARCTTTSTTPTSSSTIPSQGRLRYREDEFLDEQNKVVSARARLTLTGPSREAAFGSVLLFRSRFFAPATHSPRFYREYFKPAREREVEKDRRRWLVAYRGVQFYVHLDRLLNPHAGGYFLEVKSRTWSRRDAQDKAAVIMELLERLGARPDDIIESDYVKL